MTTPQLRLALELLSAKLCHPFALPPAQLRLALELLSAKLNTRQAAAPQLRLALELLSAKLDQQPTR